MTTTLLERMSESGETECSIDEMMAQRFEQVAHMPLYWRMDGAYFEYADGVCSFVASGDEAFGAYLSSR